MYQMPQGSNVSGFDWAEQVSNVFARRKNVEENMDIHSRYIHILLYIYIGTYYFPKHHLVCQDVCMLEDG